MVGLLRLAAWLFLTAGIILAAITLPGNGMNQKLACLGLDTSSRCPATITQGSDAFVARAIFYVLAGALCALVLTATALLLRRVAQIKDAMERLAVIAEAEDTLPGAESERILASEITENPDGTFEIGGRVFREQDSAEKYKHLIRIRTE